MLERELTYEQEQFFDKMNQFRKKIETLEGTKLTHLITDKQYIDSLKFITNEITEVVKEFGLIEPEPIFKPSINDKFQEVLNILEEVKADLDDMMPTHITHDDIGGMFEESEAYYDRMVRAMIREIDNERKGHSN